MTWKCVCGKVHEIKRGLHITCTGRGHHVYIHWSYFFPGENDVEEIKPKTSAQASLFQ